MSGYKKSPAATEDHVAEDSGTKSHVRSGTDQPIEEGLIGCPFLIGAIGKRFDQKLAMLRDPRLIQIAGDVCTLICGRIRAQDRSGAGA